MTQSIRDPIMLPERDLSKSAEQQGLFRKFDVRRTDGSDAPGGKHHGCRYFVLDVNHDAFATAALGAYAAACESTHPELARDLREKWGASPAALTDKQIAAQDARYAIDGAITYGRMGTNKPEAGHWLREYWSIGRQLAKLGETSIWDNQTPVKPSLWMIHIEGPDDLVAAPTKKEAERVAAAVNEFHDAHAAKRRAEIAAAGGNPEHFPTTRAVVLPYEGSIEEHAASLAADWDGYVEYVAARSIQAAATVPSASPVTEAGRLRAALWAIANTYDDHELRQKAQEACDAPAAAESASPADQVEDARTEPTLTIPVEELVEALGHAKSLLEELPAYTVSGTRTAYAYNMVSAAINKVQRAAMSASKEGA